MAEERICALCGNPMKGLASITIGEGPKRWYCHDEERPSCYEKAQRPFSKAWRLK